MNTKTVFSISGVSALFAMLGCSTPPPAVSDFDPALNVPPPEVSYELPLEEPKLAQEFRTCKLGTSCLTMDPRPFEPCLLSTKECAEKAAESQLVDGPDLVAPPPVIIKTR